MSHTPTTIRAEPSGGFGPGWNDASSLHRSDDGGGVLSGLKSVRHGTLAELIRFILTLPESERGKYEIEKSGDHRLSNGEIIALSQRADFPAA